MKNVVFQKISKVMNKFLIIYIYKITLYFTLIPWIKTSMVLFFYLISETAFNDFPIKGTQKKTFVQKLYFIAFKPGFCCDYCIYNRNYLLYVQKSLQL